MSEFPSSLLNFAVRSRSRRIFCRGFGEAVTSGVSVSVGLSEEFSMVYINGSMPSISPSDLTFITSILHDILDGNIHFWPLSIVHIFNNV